MADSRIAIGIYESTKKVFEYIFASYFKVLSLRRPAITPPPHDTDAVMPSVHRPYNWKQPVVSELPATESNWWQLISSRIWSVCAFLPLVVHGRSLSCY